MFMNMYMCINMYIMYMYKITICTLYEYICVHVSLYEYVPMCTDMAMCVYA